MATRVLTSAQRVTFAHEFRAARADALRNAEAFEPFLFALERIGSFTTRSHRGLGHYKKALVALARESPLHFAAAKNFPQFHVSFEVLYEEARVARNDAMHQGAVARYLARHAQEIAMILEDALMTSARTAGEFMVPNPVCASSWEPVTSVRRTLLMNAFSYLPIQKDPGVWRLVSDVDLVKFLRVEEANREKRLLMTLDEAIEAGLETSNAAACGVGDPISGVLANMRDRPYLVLDSDRRLAGILTAFDLL